MWRSCPPRPHDCRRCRRQLYPRISSNLPQQPRRRRASGCWPRLGRASGRSLSRWPKALGLPFEVKTIVHRPLGSLPGMLGHREPCRRRSRAGRTRLRVPGRTRPARPSPQRGGGALDPADVGRALPTGADRPILAAARLFDLVVTTPQYGLPAAHNVLHNALPLHAVSAERLALAAQAWRPRLAHLPGPFVTVLVGGSSGPYRFDAAAATRLGREASALARRLGGSVLVTTSARTPAAAADALVAAIDAPAFVHRWSPGSGTTLISA